MSYDGCLHSICILLKLTIAYLGLSCFSRFLIICQVSLFFSATCEKCELCYFDLNRLLALDMTKTWTYSECGQVKCDNELHLSVSDVISPTRMPVMGFLLLNDMG